MIKLTIQDLHKGSPRCPDDCSKYEVEGCAGCSLRFRTVFACPHCKTIKHFYGINNLINCTTCNRQIPDMYAMTIAKHHYVRAKYHLERITP